MSAVSPDISHDVSFDMVEGAPTFVASTGRLTADAPLAPLVWFKSGGSTDWLYEPRDVDALQAFLQQLAPSLAVRALGLGSNLLVRDGGVRGVTVRLGKAIGKVRRCGPSDLYCGGGASGVAVASAARNACIGGLEFLRGIPGSIGGMVRMNAGAYGHEMCDILRSADVLLRSGERVRLTREDLGYRYRHSALPPDAIVVGAQLSGYSEQRAVICAKLDEIVAEREATQPLRSRTGGSTFRNPPNAKAWQLIDAAGCRGLQLGKAQVSKKHCNFLLNMGGACSRDIEMLGEEVRRRVENHSGITLQWEIERVGEW